MGQEKAGEPGIGSMRVLMALSGRCGRLRHVRPDSTTVDEIWCSSAHHEHVELKQSRARAISSKKESVEENSKCTVHVGVRVSR
jgi:hypothetical protein